jgi:hypothetical protein
MIGDNVGACSIADSDIAGASVTTVKIKAIVMRLF